jgi:hypothetical protein
MKAVVVGNGPSLRDHLRRGHFDGLTSLGIPSFACNLIDLLYDPNPDADLPGTTWRPTYYVWMEFVGYSRGYHPRSRLETYDRVLDFHILPNVERCFIGHRFKSDLEKRSVARSLPTLPRFQDPTENLIWLEGCSSYHGVQFDNHRRPNDWHLPTPCVYGGTMNTVLSLAFMHGFDDVAVIGCDLGIVAPAAGTDFNHFDPTYHTFLDGQFEKQDGTLDHVHSIARKNFERVGHRLVNAGIGGRLEALPRLSLVDWLAE